MTLEERAQQVLDEAKQLPPIEQFARVKRFARNESPEAVQALCRLPDFRRWLREFAAPFLSIKDHYPTEPMTSDILQQVERLLERE